MHLYAYIYEINHDLPWNNNIVLHNQYNDFITIYCQFFPSYFLYYCHTFYICFKHVIHYYFALGSKSYLRVIKNMGKNLFYFMYF